MPTKRMHVWLMIGMFFVPSMHGMGKGDLFTAYVKDYVKKELRRVGHDGMIVCSEGKRCYETRTDPDDRSRGKDRLKAHIFHHHQKDFLRELFPHVEASEVHNMVAAINVKLEMCCIQASNQTVPSIMCPFIENGCESKFSCIAKNGLPLKPGQTMTTLRTHLRRFHVFDLLRQIAPHLFDEKSDKKRRLQGPTDFRVSTKRPSSRELEDIMHEVCARLEEKDRKAIATKTELATMMHHTEEYWPEYLERGMSLFVPYPHSGFVTD